MSPLPNNNLSAELQRIALQLRPLEPKGSFSVLKTAENLGAHVELRFYSLGKRRDAQLETLNSPPRIILFRRSEADGSRSLSSSDENLLTTRERFSIAHELGHLLATEQLHVKPPQEKSEYWEQEASMNAFASELLVPGWLVEGWLRSIPKEKPIPPLALRQWARHECNVSEEVVAHAICRVGSGIGFMKGALRANTDRPLSILKVLFSVNTPALALPAINSHITYKDLLEELNRRPLGAQTFRSCALGKVAPQDLTISWRRVSSLKKSSGQQGYAGSISEEIFWLSFSSIAEDDLLQLRPLEELFSERNTPG